MSDTNNKQTKVWADGISIKSRDTQFGQVLSVGVNVDKFVAFLNKNKNEKGYANLDIMERKEVGTYGETHNCSLNNWKKPEEGKSNPAPVKPIVKAKTPASKTVTPPDDEIPF